MQLLGKIVATSIIEIGKIDLFVTFVGPCDREVFEGGVGAKRITEARAGRWFLGLPQRRDLVGLVVIVYPPQYAGNELSPWKLNFVAYEKLKTVSMLGQNWDMRVHEICRNVAEMSDMRFRATLWPTREVTTMYLEVPLIW